jgi:hypothetical protein
MAAKTQKQKLIAKILRVAKKGGAGKAQIKPFRIQLATLQQHQLQFMLRKMEAKLAQQQAVVVQAPQQVVVQTPLGPQLVTQVPQAPMVPIQVAQVPAPVVLQQIAQVPAPQRRKPQRRKPQGKKPQAQKKRRMNYMKFRAQAIRAGASPKQGVRQAWAQYGKPGVTAQQAIARVAKKRKPQQKKPQRKPQRKPQQQKRGRVMNYMKFMARAKKQGLAQHQRIAAWTRYRTAGGPSAQQAIAQWKGAQKRGQQFARKKAQQRKRQTPRQRRKYTYTRAFRRKAKAQGLTAPQTQQAWSSWRKYNVSEARAIRHRVHGQWGRGRPVRQRSQTSKKQVRQQVAQQRAQEKQQKPVQRKKAQRKPAAKKQQAQKKRRMNYMKFRAQAIRAGASPKQGVRQAWAQYGKPGVSTQQAIARVAKKRKPQAKKKAQRKPAAKKQQAQKKRKMNYMKFRAQAIRAGASPKQGVRQAWSQYGKPGVSAQQAIARVAKKRKPQKKKAQRKPAAKKQQRKTTAGTWRSFQRQAKGKLTRTQTKQAYAFYKKHAVTMQQAIQRRSTGQWSRQHATRRLPKQRRPQAKAQRAAPKAVRQRAAALAQAIRQGRLTAKQGKAKASDYATGTAAQKAQRFVALYKGARVKGRKAKAPRRGLKAIYQSIRGQTKYPYYVAKGYQVGAYIRRIPGYAAKPFSSLSKAQQQAVVRFLNTVAGQKLRATGAGPGRSARGIKATMRQGRRQSRRAA